MKDNFLFPGKYYLKKTHKIMTEQEALEKTADSYNIFTQSETIYKKGDIDYEGTADFYRLIIHSEKLYLIRRDIYGGLEKGLIQITLDELNNNYYPLEEFLENASYFGMYTQKIDKINGKNHSSSPILVLYKGSNHWLFYDNDDEYGNYPRINILNEQDIQGNWVTLDNITIKDPKVLQYKDKAKIFKDLLKEHLPFNRKSRT